MKLYTSDQENKKNKGVHLNDTLDLNWKRILDLTQTKVGQNMKSCNIESIRGENSNTIGRTYDNTATFSTC